MRAERVVGASSEREEVLLDEHRQEVEQIRSGHIPSEREKTADELLMIAYAEKNVNRLREKYGLAPIRVTPEHVKTIRGEHVTLGDTTLRGAGGYSAMVETAFFTDAEELGRESIGRLDTIQHELIHLGQYQTLQLRENNVLTDYRTGLGIQSRRPNESGEYGPYLLPLHEAVTEENSRRLTLAIASDDPELGHIVKKREEEFNEFLEFCEKNPQHGYPDLLLSGDVLRSEINPENGRPRVYPFAYYYERQAMWKLFDKIHERNPGAFPDMSREEAREAMFDMVTKASFDGDIRPFGRLMNETFGLGTFRNYGHLQTAQEIVDLIDTLDRINGDSLEAQQRAGANPEGASSTEERKDEGDVKDAEVEDNKK
jgi:hypothetical protein